MFISSDGDDRDEVLQARRMSSGGGEIVQMAVFIPFGVRI
jgi:hypothetical protein